MRVLSLHRNQYPRTCDAIAAPFTGVDPSITEEQYQLIQTFFERVKTTQQDDAQLAQQIGYFANGSSDNCILELFERLMAITTELQAETKNIVSLGTKNPGTETPSWPSILDENKSLFPNACTALIEIFGTGQILPEEARILNALFEQARLNHREGTSAKAVDAQLCDTMGDSNITDPEHLRKTVLAAAEAFLPTAKAEASPATTATKPAPQIDSSKQVDSLLRHALSLGPHQESDELQHFYRMVGKVGYNSPDLLNLLTNPNEWGFTDPEHIRKEMNAIIRTGEEFERLSNKYPTSSWPLKNMLQNARLASHMGDGLPPIQIEVCALLEGAERLGIEDKYLEERIRVTPLAELKNKLLPPMDNNIGTIITRATTQGTAVNENQIAMKQ